MDLRLPMQVFKGPEPAGQLLSYGYETPWASGTFVALDPEALRRWIAVCELQEACESWPDEPDLDPDEQRWQAELAARGIEQADSDQFAEGPWRIQSQDGSLHELPAPPVFDRQGFLTWRW